MAEDLGSRVVNFVVTVGFIVLLPFFMIAILFIPGLSRDEIWFTKVAFTFLAPFSAVLWYILVHRVLTGRRSSYLLQVAVFVAMALVIYALLRSGVYSLRM